MMRIGMIGLLLLLLSAGSLVAQFASRDVILQNAAAANGNGTTADSRGYSTIAVQIVIPTGASPAAFTVNFEQSLNNNHFTATLCLPLTNGAPATSATTASHWRCNISGSIKFRARISGYTGPGAISAFGLMMAGGTLHAAGLINNYGVTWQASK